jgi:signal transduction histidine kinase
MRIGLPRPTVRLRLTAVYSSLFLVCCVLLLGITYLLVRHQLTETFFITSGKPALVALAGTTQQFTIRARGVIPGPIGGPSPKEIVAAAHSQSVATLHEFVVDAGIALAVMAVLSMWLGWIIAGRALRPLRVITNTAREISASNLHRRLDLGGPDDELKQLGVTFDGLLGRLEQAFDAQTQFVANASHELRTPLTFERTVLEVALSDPNLTVDSLRHACEQVLASGIQQERLIEALLTLSRSQGGLDRSEPVDLAAIARSAADAVDHPGIAFETRFGAAETRGDPRLVERLVANLVANAVAHNVPAGTVWIVTETRAGTAVLRVSNTGPPVPAGDVPRLFRPFERLDDRRADGRTAGVGLGLSIVEAVARAHDAVIDAKARADGGLDIEVSFAAEGSAEPIVHSMI